MSMSHLHLHLHLLLSLSLLFVSVFSDLSSDRSSLLSFLNSVPHSRRLDWNATSTNAPCDWRGITCDASSTFVFAIRLPGIGLQGSIPQNTIGNLAGLRVLSLHSNLLSGQIPDLTNLTRLRSIYLHRNQFSGQFPALALPRLSRLDLSYNNLDGEIPFGINNLSTLTGLFLQDNNFSGALPAINIDSLLDFNVSNNRLNGSIPTGLARFTAASFQGNLGLCGEPLPPCNPFFPSPSPSPQGNSPAIGSSEKKRLSTAAIIGIAVAAGVLLIVFLMLLIWFLFRRRQREAEKKEATSREAAVAVGTAAPRSGETLLTSSSGGGGVGAAAPSSERNRLVFVGPSGGYSFDLEDLLRASAEVLGKGSTGTSYKAVLEDGATVVVKRLKDVVVQKREYEAHIEGLAKMKEQQNLLPIRAYYYSNDEKLLVFDYINGGSLSSLLHGSRGSGRTPLDWDSRMRIALGAARGLYHLHTVANVVHGNVKASNVLLRSELDASVLSDYGLHPLFGFSSPPSRLAGYRAPEVVETRRPTFKSDMYSFGVLMLELLTGKAPNQTSIGDDIIDLPRWVQSVVREEWTAEVFDVELLRYQNIEEEMVQLLQIAMACVATVPDSRPEISKVLEMIGKIGNRGEGS